MKRGRCVQTHIFFFFSVRICEKEISGRRVFSTSGDGVGRVGCGCPGGGGEGKFFFGGGSMMGCNWQSVLVEREWLFFFLWYGPVYVYVTLPLVAEIPHRLRSVVLSSSTVF